MKMLAYGMLLVACTRGDMCCSYWTLPESLATHAEAR